MADSYVLVLDGGTTNLRCFVFDRHGETVGSCHRPWRSAAEQNVSSLTRSFELPTLWQDFCTVIKGAVKDAGTAASQIAAVAVTTQRQSVVFLDKTGDELYAGPNTDLRAVFEGAAIDEEHSDDVYRTTGHLPSFLFAPAKLRWFQNQRPELYGRIATALTLGDWAVWRLTGTLASTPTLAAEAGLLDIHRRQMCMELLGEMGLSTTEVPIAEAGTMVGTIGEKAASETGLTMGTPVAAAGADTQCALLGMGMAGEHRVGIVAGWSVPLQMVTAQPVLSPDAKTWAGCHLSRDKWVLESGAGDAGGSYRWLVDLACEQWEDRFTRADEMAGKIPVGSEDCLAFLGPSRMDMTNLGMRMGGFLFPVPLTFGEMGRGQMLRASLEATAYAIRSNLEQIEALAGFPAAGLALGGGMTRTRTFVRLLTDVIGRQIELSSTPQASAQGAYLCARTALGDFQSLEAAAQSVNLRLQSIEPDPLDSAEYQERYERWLRTSEELQSSGM